MKTQLFENDATATTKINKSGLSCNIEVHIFKFKMEDSERKNHCSPNGLTVHVNIVLSAQLPYG